MATEKTEKRLIDANALTHEIIFVKKCLASEDKAGEWTNGYRSGLVAALAQIDELPTVDAVEVVHGRWECVNEDANVWMCAGKDGCGNELILLESTPKHNGWDYCPYCGAKMDGDGNG